jgi:hypothetical protein
MVPLKAWWTVGETRRLAGERHFLVTGFAGDRVSAAQYPPHRREEWVPAEADPAAADETGTAPEEEAVGLVSASLLKPMAAAKGISCFACKEGQSPATDPFGNGWIFPPTSRTLEVGDVVSTTSMVVRRVQPAAASGSSSSKTADRSPRLADGGEFEWVQAFGQHKGSGDWFMLCAYQRPVLGDSTARRPAWWAQELGAAEAAFMRIDTDRQGFVSVHRVGALIGLLTAEGGADPTAASTIAEGFDADELDAAKRALDAGNSGIISRARFCAFWDSA